MTGKILKTAAKVVVVALILAFLILAIYRNYAKLSEMEFSFSFWPFLASTLLILLVFFAQSYAWGNIIGALARPLRFRDAAGIWFASQVSKYVPGKVMLPLVRMTMGRRVGIDIGRTTLSIYLELVMMNGAVVIVFLLSMLGWPDSGMWAFLADKIGMPGGGERLSYLVLLFVPLCLIAIHPKLLEWMINRGLRLLKKNPISLTIGYGRVLLLFALQMLAWVIYGLSCWLLMVSLGVDDPALALRIVGAFTFSWFIGFVSFVTPGGIGVREAVLTGLMAMWGFNVGIAMVAAGLARLQWTGMELVGAALTLRYRPISLDEIKQDHESDQPTA